jgi:opacity protein-like surface antigen
MRLVAAAAVATGLAVSAGGAAAQGMFGGGSFYIKGFGGATWPQDDNFDLNSRTGGASFGTGLNYDTGYVLGVAGGWEVTPNVAVELEYAYRNADADLRNIANAGDAKTESNAWMLNGLYKFHGVGPNAAFRPYVGAGLGAADLNVEDVGDALGGDFDSDYNFAYQVITGVAYNVAPNFDITGEVRYFGINGQDLENDAFSIDSDYQTFDLLIGASYRF